MSDLAVKIQNGDDVRRVNLKNTRFSDLLESIRVLFGIHADQYRVCYQDEDKDFITVTTDLELNEALIFAKKANSILRLFIKESKVKPVVSPLPQAKVEAISLKQEESSKQMQDNSMELFPGTNDLFDSVIETLATGSEVLMKGINEGISALDGVTKLVVEDSEKKVDVIEPFKHEAVCDSCKTLISGIRYKCGNCDDFDLCDHCESLKLHDSEHVFLKLYRNISLVPKALLPLLYVPSNIQVTKKEKDAILIARLIKDVTVEDGSIFKKGQKFVKVWRLKNDGEVAWTPGCRLILTEGCSLGPVNFVAVPAVKPGEEIDIAVDLVAPNQPGRYASYWRLSTNNGVRFGHRIWVDITVLEEKAPEPIPQPVVQPISQPISQPVVQPISQPISQPIAASEIPTEVSGELTGPVFQVKVSERSLKISSTNNLVDIEFIITKDNDLVFRVAATKDVRMTHNLTHLKRWAVIENAITLDFAEWESGFVTLQTPIASQIGSLITNRIGSILEQQAPKSQVPIVPEAPKEVEPVKEAPKVEIPIVEPPKPVETVKEVPKAITTIVEPVKVQPAKEVLPDGVLESDMEKLAEFGFFDRKKNATLLLKHKGDIVKVVTELVE